MIKEIELTLRDLRSCKPLILCLTNYVTMDFMANTLLAVGAAPLMSLCDAELEELIKISHAININIGTLDEVFMQRCLRSIAYAKTYGKPVILDPVGAGASLMRTRAARELMVHIDIIRGNASEILALTDNDAKTLGVESKNITSQVKSQAMTLAKHLNCTIVVSGKEDFITDGIKETSLTYGSELMTLVTGMGCALTAVIAAFAAVHSDAYAAAYLASAYFGLCGNIASANTDNPGTFRQQFIDALYGADFKAFLEKENA